MKEPVKAHAGSVIGGDRNSKINNFLNRSEYTTEMPVDNMVYASRVVPQQEVKEQPIPAMDAPRLVDILARLKTDEEASGLKITIERAEPQSDLQSDFDGYLGPDSQSKSKGDSNA